MEEKIIVKQHGGKREGAGRKKVVPEGARYHTFALSDEETKEVKRFISAMRKGNESKKSQPTISINEVQDTAFNIMVSTAKSIASALIKLNGGAPYEEVEFILKDAAMIGFKDAVSEYERHNKTK